MSRKKTQAEFINEVKTKLPDLIILGEYKNNKSRITVECSKCGNIWEPMAQSLLNGHGCKKCAGNSRLTQDEFVMRVGRDLSNVDVVGTYVNSSTEVKVKCKKCGYEWTPKANSLLNGRGCPKCKGVKKKTNSEFQEELKKINPNVILLSEYTNNRMHIKVKCADCDYEWSTSPKSLLRGSNCPKCVKRMISMTSAKSDEVFRKELSVINPNVVIWSEYKNNRTHIDVSCKKCGYRWKATPNALLKSKGCPICTGNTAVSKGINDLETTKPDLAKEWMYEKNNPLKPSEVRAGSTKKVWWIGKCGHEWEATICSRNKGSGCPICANNIKKSTDRFIREMGEYNPNIEIIGDYKTAQKPIKVRCKICGYEWISKPINLLRGTGCTNCVKKQTSFMEQFLLISFRMALSESVLERDTGAVGMELDIYIPSLKLAIEPGSWLYHMDKVEGIDAEKRKKCSLKNIRLITIYDTYPRDTKPPFDKDCYVFDGFLNEFGYKRIINLAQKIMMEYGIKYTYLDWKEIANKAYEACHYNANESFIEKLSVKRPNIEVLEEYKGSNIPILVNDKTCNHPAWKARPYTLLNGNGCPLCGKKLAIEKRTRTQEEYVEELKELNPRIKVVGTFKRINERVEVECLDCGHRWNPLAYSLTQGKGCPHCSAVRGAKTRKGKLGVKTTEQFMVELLKINDKIEICGEYKNNKTKIDARCKMCGYEWKVVAASLLNGHGCPKCARKNRIIKKEQSLKNELK